MKKLSQKAKFQLEVNRLASELKTARELNDTLREAITKKDRDHEQKDRDHELVLNEARRRTLPLKDMCWDANFLPEYIVSIDSQMEPNGFSSKFNPQFREYISGPAVVTIKVYGAVVINPLVQAAPKPVVTRTPTLAEV